MGHTKQEKDTMKLRDLLRDYDTYLHTQKPLSASTTMNYLCRLRKFLSTLPDEACLPALTKQAIVRHLNCVGESSALSVRMHYAALRHWTRWLIAEEWLRSNPTADIPLPKVKRNRRETVPDDAISRLMQACERLPRSEYRCVLAKAVLSLLVYGGLRRSEALRLPVSDVFPERGEVFVRYGKGDRSRSVYLCREGVDALRALLRARPPDCQHNLLLASNRRFHLTYHGLDTLLRDLHRVAGMTERYTPHQLRHAYASRLARNGVPIHVIQAALGHSSIQTTAVYLHSNEEDLRATAHLASLSVTPPAQKIAPAPVSAKREEQRRFRVRRLR